VVFSITVIQSSFQRLLHTTNGVERLHREVRRRASVVSIFPNPAACLRLVSAILTEISEKWLTGTSSQYPSGEPI
jgi:putative transposase